MPPARPATEQHSPAIPYLRLLLFLAAIVPTRDKINPTGRSAKTNNASAPGALVLNLKVLLPNSNIQNAMDARINTTEMINPITQV